MLNDLKVLLINYCDELNCSLDAFIENDLWSIECLKKVFKNYDLCPFDFNPKKVENDNLERFIDDKTIRNYYKESIRSFKNRMKYFRKFKKMVNKYIVEIEKVNNFDDWYGSLEYYHITAKIVGIKEFIRVYYGNNECFIKMNSILERINNVISEINRIEEDD